MSQPAVFYEITYRVKWKTEGQHGEAPYEDPMEALRVANRRALLGFTVVIEIETTPVEGTKIPPAAWWSKGL